MQKLAAVIFQIGFLDPGRPCQSVGVINRLSLTNEA